jgi:hypothetical protein
MLAWNYFLKDGSVAFLVLKEESSEEMEESRGRGRDLQKLLIGFWYQLLCQLFELQMSSSIVGQVLHQNDTVLL